MRKLLGWSLLGAAAGIGVGACSASGGTGFTGDAGPTEDGGTTGDAASLLGDGAVVSPDGGGTTLIYAHTDTELYSMDPVSHAVTDIGKFDDGSGALPPITDLAINSKDEIWVNSETAIYQVTLPPGGTGKVTVTQRATLGAASKFFALGFVPAGVLGTGETLITGDSKGDLYYVDTAGGAAPQNLGGFGPDGTKTWELSGDVVFYSVNGTPKGVATIRACTGTTGAGCTTTNDSLAEIDMVALKTAFDTKTPAASLRKQILGGGTGFGRLFGIGAWGDNVYAFARASGTTTSAQLVQINAAGVGTSLKTFPGFTNGWSGAGVNSAKANITIIR